MLLMIYLLNLINTTFATSIAVPKVTAPPFAQNIVTYIGVSEWCLSIGNVINGRHGLANDNEVNIYWCHNDKSDTYNQDCQCIKFGLFANDAPMKFNYNGKEYKFEGDKDMGDGNQIQGSCKLGSGCDGEINCKASSSENGGDNLTWNVAKQTWCGNFEINDDAKVGNSYKDCCLEWDLDVDQYIDGIDGKTKDGREAKFDCDDGGDRVQGKLAS